LSKLTVNTLHRMHSLVQ